jgi:integrase
MGLGPFPTVTQSEARQTVLEARRLLHRGDDPLAARRQIREAARARTGSQSESFDTVAGWYIEAHAAGWRNRKTAAQWRASLRSYASPRFGTKSVAEISIDDLLAVLRPIWNTKTVTATRLRGRIEAILDYAKVRSLREGENPARWRGHLELLLASPSAVRAVKHHAALPIDNVTDLMATLGSTSGTAALALQFLLLTAARGSEVTGATWPEIDLRRAVWIVPAARMKTNREHRVPLSEPAAAVLKTAASLQRKSDILVFPGQRRNRPLSLTGLMKALRTAGGINATVHGLRSTFRDWCAERDHTPRELAEAALAHVSGSETERAYARSDLLERRRALMNRWADFACSSAKATAKRRRR